MEKISDELAMLFDWWVPYYEQACPKAPEPKMPTNEIIRRAAMRSYDNGKEEVPARFMAELGGISAKDRREIALMRIRKWARKYCSAYETYMREFFKVNVVFQDGDPTSKGKRIISNRPTNENVDAVRAQAKWDSQHCNGTHKREDTNAEQFNTLMPKVAVERHKLVPLLLPKSR